MFDAGLITEKHSTQVVISRNDFIFTTAALSLLGGLLAPVGPQFVDIFWVLSVCLGGAIVLIGFSAKETGELSSFPLLLVAGSWLRIALTAASARLIFLGGTGGYIIEGIGGAIGSGKSILIMVITTAASIVGGLFIYGSTKRIIKSSLRFAFDTMPLKQISIETELNAGLIDKGRASMLKSRIAGETQFYINMAGVTKLLLCDAAISVLVVILTGAGQTAITAIDRISSGNGILTQPYVSLSAAVAILSLLPAVLTTAAAAHLSGKSTLSLGEGNSNEQHSRTVKIVSQESGRKEKVELLNPEFAQVGAREVLVAKNKSSDENITRFEPVGRAGEAGIQSTGCKDKYESIEDYYSDLTGRIEGLPSEQKTVLFGAASIEELPVTVAVNVAIKLSERERRCLLIDADTKRGAVAKVFELGSDEIKDRTAETCIKNLSIRNGSDLAGVDIGAAKEKIQAISKDYDRVIIYAPNMNSANGGATLSYIAAGAIVFERGGGNNNLTRPATELGCKLVAIMPAACSVEGTRM